MTSGRRGQSRSTVAGSGISGDSRTRELVRRIWESQFFQDVHTIRFLLCHGISTITDLRPGFEHLRSRHDPERQEFRSQPEHSGVPGHDGHQSAPMKRRKLESVGLDDQSLDGAHFDAPDASCSDASHEQRIHAEKMASLWPREHLTMGGPSTPVYGQGQYDFILRELQNSRLGHVDRSRPSCRVLSCRCREGILSL